MKKILTIGLVIFVATAAGLYIYGNQKNKEPTRPIQELSIKAAVYKGEFSSLIYLAQNLGFFDNQNLVVEITEFDTGVGPVSSMIAGEADVATSGDYVFSSQALQHPEIRIITECNKANAIELIARRSSGINSTEDLRGKKIGFVPGTQSQYFLEQFLVLNALVPTDIESVSVSPKELIEKVSTGELDGGLIWEPNVYKIKQSLGNDAISWGSQTGLDFFFLISTSDQYAQNHREELVRFLRALEDAQNYVANNNDEAKDHMRQLLGYDQTMMNYLWPKNSFNLGINQESLIMIEAEIIWINKQGENPVRQDINILDFLEIDPLLEVSDRYINVHL